MKKNTKRRLTALINSLLSEYNRHLVLIDRGATRAPTGYLYFIFRPRAHYGVFTLYCGLDFTVGRLKENNTYWLDELSRPDSEELESLVRAAIKLMPEDTTMVTDWSDTMSTSGHHGIGLNWLVLPTVLKIVLTSLETESVEERECIPVTILHAITSLGAFCMELLRWPRKSG